MFHKLIKEFPRAIILSVSIFLVLFVIKLITGVTIQLNEYLLVNLGYTILYGLTLYYVNAFLFIYLDSIFEVERFTKKRIIIGFLGSFVISVVVIFLLRIVEDVLIEGENFDVFLQKETLANYLVTIIITFFVTLSFHAFYYYKAYQENKVKEQKIIAGTASAQFESLKNQIDPHFLFNSLNVLSSLIEENPESAQKFTTSLSKVYRYVLEQKDKELVSVAEELKFAKTYMNLLKMRFENSITFEIPEGFDNEEAKVVPLSLQLLLENCIKHNVVSEAKPLHVKISIENNQLAVTNNLQKKEVLSDRKGVGLENIVNRYRILTNRKVIVEENEKEFKISIPILTKQISVMETQNIFNENLAYKRAKDKVEQLRGFYGNLISYCTVIPILILINLNTSNFQWFWFPMLGWGIGLTFHALETFGYSKSWEERKINEFMNEENNKLKTWK
ncbi:2TM domain-containing protein [uncultured Flavobacterium sp.]|uniref:2TM domain-containing protein n=1 Tax=uncultured Flavobacterium sp. TaxID=165435 RepID=UPI002599207A|nr:2TM domain-containing protein [uncultured Flavobacterium sp.]